MRSLSQLFAFKATSAHPPLAELKAKYRAWDYTSVVLFILLVPYCVFALHEFFMWDAELVASDLGDSVYTLLPDSNFWYVPASVLGVILACVLISVFFDWLLDTEVFEYRQYSNKTSGINASRLYLIFGVLMGGGFSLLAVCAAHSSLQLTQDGLVIHRLFGTGEERYAYDRVRALKKSLKSDGGSIFVIEFEDAPEWSTAVEVIFPGEQEIAFLSERSHKPLQTYKAK